MEKYDVIIIGAGPAGLTSALYGARANRKVLVLDGEFGLGEAGKIMHLENYPGIESVDGLSFLFALQSQAKKAGAEIVSESVTRIDCSAKTVTTKNRTYNADNIILATGCKSQKLGLKGEKELIGYGVSYCATCDGTLFRGREVALVGRGRKAEDDVRYLAKIVKKVYYITSDKNYIADNVENLDVKVLELVGNPLEKIILSNQKQLYVPVIFVNIGYLPETSLVLGQVKTDEKGYIITDENMQTDVKGIYAVGDIRQKSLRQIVTACADGAVAVEHAIRRKK
ncbi:MAG: FAD-binding protein [Clostridiales bacterium]|nr:FAD-binding protein [Clostridiales bacterium]